MIFLEGRNQLKFVGAGFNTSLIIIWQPLYLTHQQLNVQPDETNCSSCHLVKQGENVTEVPVAQNDPSKNQEWTLWRLSWAMVIVSRDKQAVSATRRSAEGKTLMGYAPQITSGRMHCVCWPYRATEGEFPGDQQDSSTVFTLVMLSSSAGVIPFTKLLWSVNGSASPSLTE